MSKKKSNKKIDLSGLMTEATSNHQNLDKMSLKEIFSAINQEDQSVPLAVKKSTPQIENLTTTIVRRMKKGGRLFYIGAGTSGRLGIVDASECPPTFGVSPEKVIGIMAGGDKAIRKAQEGAEDDEKAAWKDLAKYKPNKNDTIIGLAASGRTPYVVGGLKDARRNGLVTGCIVCNENSPVAAASDHPVEVVVGPEFLTGSTRMKAGSAQKMVLNMISTATMIQLGHVQGNKMTQSSLSCEKLKARATNTLMEMANINEKDATRYLEKHGSVKDAMKAISNSGKNNPKDHIKPG
jgi:N-acetylmuramic acid 6-phosphate etherase